MIFLTAGTYPIPFDRLLEAVDDAVGSGVVDEDVFAQVGCSTYRPRHMEFVSMLGKEEFDAKVKAATGIIGQAGMGTISMALDHELPVLVMPRLKRFGEIVNDHQLATARKFEALGHVLVAHDASEMREMIPRLRSFVPKKRVATPRAVAERIGAFLAEL